MSEVVFGVDSSTQSTKLEVRSMASGRLLWEGKRPHPPTHPPVSEQDPESWWQALSPLLEEARSSWRPAAISVAAQQHGLVALDAKHSVIRPAKLWNDTTCAEDVEALVARRPPSWWVDHCGSVPSTSFTVAKVAWLARCEPSNWDRLAKVLLPHDWLTWRVSGEEVTDAGDASGTGYFDVVRRRWDTEVLELVGLDAGMLPRVCNPTEQVGSWQGAVVAPGTGDNMAAALGAAIAAGQVGVSIGTSGTVFVTSPAPVGDASGTVAGFADATGGYLPLVCTLNAARVTDTVARWLGKGPDELAAMALSCPPGSGGVVMVPYFDGERTPRLPNATGTVAGIRTDTEPEHLVRAAYEGVVCSLLEGLDALTAAIGEGYSPSSLVLLGGGARSPAYRRVLADLSGLPVRAVVGVEPVACGACVQATAVACAEDPKEVAARWGLGGGALLDPDPMVPREEIRQRWREVRERVYGLW
jgi:xylulokinase